MGYFRLLLALVLIFASTSASAFFLQCQSKDGTQRFRIIEQPQKLPGENAYAASMRALGLTREQGVARGISCIEVMGLDDPRPWTRELAEKKFREENVDCLPPDEVAALRNGTILYKMHHGCTEDLSLSDLQFMLGVMSVGMDECGFSPSIRRNLSYVGTAAAIWANLRLQTDLVEGTAYGRAFGCGSILEKLTEGGGAWFEANPDAPSNTFRKAVRDNDR